MANPRGNWLATVLAFVILTWMIHASFIHWSRRNDSFYYVIDMSQQVWPPLISQYFVWSVFIVMIQPLVFGKWWNSRTSGNCWGFFILFDHKICTMHWRYANDNISFSKGCIWVTVCKQIHPDPISDVFLEVWCCHMDSWNPEVNGWHKP